MATRTDNTEFRTKAIHGGKSNDPATGAVVPPIHLSSTYARPGADQLGPFDYARTGNPTRHAFEKTMAVLEGGERGLAFASGMAAIHCVTLLLNQGDHILAGTDIYGGTYRLFHDIATQQGASVSLAPSHDFEAFARKITDRTRLIWIETPGNPLISVTDIARCAELARERGILLAVDSTLATPALTRPLELGADIVMHSATKYLGGHSDILGGLLVAKEQELGERLHFIQNATGAVMGPLEAFLCSRGVKTLELRIREQSETTLRLAKWLASDRRVARVFYPGLADNPGHELARQQMDGAYGALLSFEFDGDYRATQTLVENTQVFQLAVSLGAVESLIEQPASMSHASYAAEDREANGISDGLIRLSVGLEAYSDLKADLDNAMGKAQ